MADPNPRSTSPTTPKKRKSNNISSSSQPYVPPPSSSQPYVVPPPSSSIDSTKNIPYVIFGHGLIESPKDTYNNNSNFAFVVKAKCGQNILVSKFFEYISKMINPHENIQNLSGPLTQEKKIRIGQILNNVNFYTDAPTNTKYNLRLELLLHLPRYQVDADLNGIIPLNTLINLPRLYLTLGKPTMSIQPEPFTWNTSEYVENIIRRMYRFAIFPDRPYLTSLMDRERIHYKNGTQYYKHLIDKLIEKTSINLNEIQRIMQHWGGVYYHLVCRGFPSNHNFMHRFEEKDSRMVMPVNTLTRLLSNKGHRHHGLMQKFYKDIYNSNREGEHSNNEVSKYPVRKKPKYTKGGRKRNYKNKSHKRNKYNYTKRKNH